MKPFNWTCPYCNHAAVINEYKYEDSTLTFDMGNKYGRHHLVIRVIVCPNKECGEFTLHAGLMHASGVRKYKKWQLIPSSAAKVYPSYIPSPIIQDYEEACLIVDKSPKAAATLARRCLQGMIRDFWGVSKGRLVDEIEAIKERLEPDVLAAINAVRAVGNIGAHMERNINVIVDVDPGEAEQLIALIEMLMKEWYIARHERQKRLLEIKKMAEQKEKAKKRVTATAEATPE